jgi:hypothetical protein
MAYADIQAMNYLLSAISTTIQVIKLMDISIDYWICLFPTAILNNTAMHDKLYLFYSNKLYFLESYYCTDAQRFNLIWVVVSCCELMSDQVK